MSQASSTGKGGGAGSIKTINGDTGSITGSTVTIFANRAVNHSGSSVGFDNSGTISTLSVTDTNYNTLIGFDSGNSSVSGGGATLNTGVGSSVLTSLTSGVQNTGLGISALTSVTSGRNNLALGIATLSTLTTGNTNIGIGWQAGANLVSGSVNILIGDTAGTNYTTSESSNILINHAGVVGESHVIRIGTPGSAGEQQNKAFLAGVTGVTVAGSAPVGVDTNGQLSSLGFGTATNVLTSNGAGSSPTWQAAGGFTAVNWSVKLSGNISNVTGDNTQYAILYDTVTFDTASGYSAGTGLYTIPTTGKYFISITHFVFGGGVADTVFLGFLLINGATNVRLMDANPGNLGLTANGEFMQSATFLYSATAGDTIGAYVQVSGGTKNVGVAGGTESCLFSGFRVA